MKQIQAGKTFRVKYPIDLGSITLEVNCRFRVIAMEADKASIRVGKETFELPARVIRARAH